MEKLLRVEHPLHIAAREGHVEIIRILLKQPGTEKNAMDTSGDTALSIAATNGQESAVEVKTICLFVCCKCNFFLNSYY